MVDPYDFLVRFLENVNNYFRSYGLIYLSEIKSIHRQNEQEPDPANHLPYPVFNTILQELEGFEADNRKDEPPENNKQRNKKQYIITFPLAFFALLNLYIDHSC